MRLTNQQAVAQATNQQRLLIDIRRPDEWQQTGTPFYAVLLCGSDATFMHELEILTNGNKNAPLAVMCAAGKRSAVMQQHLQQHGYTNVADVHLGMAGHLAANLPVRPYQFTNHTVAND